MLAPLDGVEINTLLNKLPQRTQLAQERHSLLDGLEHIVNLLLGREPADTEADTAVRALVAVAQRAENVRRLERGRCACGTRRQGDVLERHEKRLALDVGEGDVHAAWVVVVWGAVERGVFELQQAVLEAVRERGDALCVVL